MTEPTPEPTPEPDDQTPGGPLSGIQIVADGYVTKAQPAEADPTEGDQP